MSRHSNHARNGENAYSHKSPSGPPSPRPSIPRTTGRIRIRGGCPQGLLLRVRAVTCPDCGARTESPRSQPLGGSTLRFRACACGFKGTTEERWIKVRPHRAGTVPAHVPATARTVPAPLGGRGGLSLKSVPVSSLLSLSNPEPTSVVSKQEEKRIGRGDAKDYDPEFEAIWSGVDPLPRGAKFKAFRAWSRLKPAATLILPVFLLWRQTDGWQRGFEPHLSTWLNDRGWEKAPTEGEMRGAGAAAPDKYAASRAAWASILDERNER
jgi:hypothetical protein